MKISPVDIVNKSFGSKMMGIDQGEVQIYLKMVATQMEQLLQENSALKESFREKENSLKEFRDRELMLRETLHSASLVTERMKTDSERECKLIITDAQQKAEMIIRDARDSVKKLYQEMTELKRARMQFETNLKAMAQAHLSLIDQTERFMPQMQLPSHNIAASGNSAGASAGGNASSSGNNGGGHSYSVSPLSAE